MKPLIYLVLISLFFIGNSVALLAAGSDSQERRYLSSGSKWEDMAAYSRAVVDGDWVFVSGTVGLNPKDGSISTDFDQQMDQIFINIKSALKNADTGLEDLVRVRCYLVDPKYAGAMSKKLHQYLSHVKPANTTVVTQLVVEGALIEIEVTALRKKKSAN